MPVETSVCDIPLIVRSKGDLDMVTAQRIIICKLDIMRIKMPAITRVFIMLDDYFTIEIVHNSFLVG
mgnify:CR=1 FL=1